MNNAQTSIVICASSLMLPHKFIKQVINPLKSKNQFKQGCNSFKKRILNQWHWGRDELLHSSAGMKVVLKINNINFYTSIDILRADIICAIPQI